MKIYVAVIAAALIIPTAVSAASVFDFNNFARGEKTRWMSDGGTDATVGYASRAGVPVACDTGATTSSCDESGTLGAYAPSASKRGVTVRERRWGRISIPSEAESGNGEAPPFNFVRFAGAATSKTVTPSAVTGPTRAGVRRGVFSARGDAPQTLATFGGPSISLLETERGSEGSVPEVQVVPLPAGLPLLLAGLGGLALIRRRAKG